MHFRIIALPSANINFFNKKENIIQKYIKHILNIFNIFNEREIIPCSIPYFIDK